MNFDSFLLYIKTHMIAIKPMIVINPRQTQRAKSVLGVRCIKEVQVLLLSFMLISISGLELNENIPT